MPLSKLTLLLPAIVCGIFLLVSPQAQAHILKINNGVSAVLHIPPDDLPKAKEDTRLEFSIGGGKKGFNLNECICELQVKKETKIIASKIIESDSPGNTSAGHTTVTFPEIGVYTLALGGRSTNNSFPDFNMSYAVRVESVSENNSSFDRTELVIIMAGTLGVIGILLYLWFSGAWTRSSKG